MQSTDPFTSLSPRLRACADLQVAEVRENAGRHEYDGVVQDLSPAGVRAGLAALGEGGPLADPFDDGYLTAVEAGLRTSLGDFEDHRRNPIWHISNLELACYDRTYAPEGEREQARRRHLASWPDAVGAAVEALDRVPAPVARSLLPAASGLLPASVRADEDDPVVAAARHAHERFLAHLRHAAAGGPPEATLGGAALSRMLGASEGLQVDLGRLALAADAERDRLRALLDRACARLDGGTAPRLVVRRLLSDYPSTPEQIYAEARALIAETTAFTVRAGLLAHPGGECLVGPAPESRRWAMAMMSWAAPYEADAPSWYHVTPPDPAWPQSEREDWLAVFSRTTLPAITVHEVTPGHYAHGRMLRRLTSDVRRTFGSTAFTEGWAHYVEELFIEEGFRDGDPRYAIGAAIEALIRVTRLAVSIGIHTGAHDVAEGARRFEVDAFLRGPAARAEAERATFDPTYGRYTWGKMVIRDLQGAARQAWGSSYSHLRFHNALLSLGAPPLGLVSEAVRVG